MAEIRIEKKNSPNFLPWLFGILGLILLAWLAVDVFDRDEEPELLTADEVNFPDAHLTDEPEADVYNAMKNEDKRPVATLTSYSENDKYDENWDGSNANYNSNRFYYLSSIEQIDDKDMSVHHKYSSTCLKALSNSLYALARESGLQDEANIDQICTEIKNAASEIKEDWTETTHANKIRESAMMAVNVMNTIQDERYPELESEIAMLEREAKDISAKSLTLNQKGDVKSFFEATAEVLQKMNV